MENALPHREHGLDHDLADDAGFEDIFPCKNALQRFHVWRLVAGGKP